MDTDGLEPYVEQRVSVGGGAFGASATTGPDLRGIDEKELAAARELGQRIDSDPVTWLKRFMETSWKHTLSSPSFRNTFSMSNNSKSVGHKDSFPIVDSHAFVFSPYACHFFLSITGSTRSPLKSRKFSFVHHLAQHDRLGGRAVYNQSTSPRKNN